MSYVFIGMSSITLSTGALLPYTARNVTESVDQPMNLYPSLVNVFAFISFPMLYVAI